jgi:hypothetical protein
MTTKEYALDFYRFDGEGGEGGAATASSSESTQDVTKIHYGKSEGNDQTPSHVGNDDGTQAEDLSAEWKALTGKGGKFHELYGQNVTEAIQNRFKNQQDLQGQVDQIADGLSPLFMNYGLKSGDFEGLKNAIANDEAFYQAGAERAGLDVNQYKTQLKLQADAERGRQIQEAYAEQQRQNQMFAQWESEASELQQAFPAFDLGLEIENNEPFAKLIYNGSSVRDAFISTHLDEILNGANAHATAQATQNVVDAISRRAARPAESAMHSQPAIVQKSDPSKLSNEDLDEINRRVARGETVSF